MLPQLLLALASDTNGAEPSKQQIADQVALAKQLAMILDFSLQFDQTRMLRPHLSNDFSYYRRLLPKFNKHPDVRVKDDEASGMVSAEFCSQCSTAQHSTRHSTALHSTAHDTAQHNTHPFHFDSPRPCSRPSTSL